MIVAWYPVRVEAFMRDPAGPVARNMLQRADRVRDVSSRRVGRRTHLLAATIRARQPQPPDAEVVAGDPAGRTPYLGVHLLGSRPHVIRVRRRKAVRFVSRTGAVVFATSVRHPGTRANNFLMDALPAAR